MLSCAIDDNTTIIVANGKAQVISKENGSCVHLAKQRAANNMTTEQYPKVYFYKQSREKENDK